jgi:hypothetical protein
VLLILATAVNNNIKKKYLLWTLVILLPLKELANQTRHSFQYTVTQQGEIQLILTFYYWTHVWSVRQYKSHLHARNLSVPGNFCEQSAPYSNVTVKYLKIKLAIQEWNLIIFCWMGVKLDTHLEGATSIDGVWMGNAGESIRTGGCNSTVEKSYIITTLVNNYCLRNIVRTNTQKMRWTGHVAHIGRYNKKGLF